MICRTHLDREVYAAGDLFDPVQKGIGSYLQTSRNKGIGSSKAQKTSTKATFTTKSAIEQRRLSQQQEVDKDSDDKKTRENRNI